jgi:hypothetical protein
VKLNATHRNASLNLSKANLQGTLKVEIIALQVAGVWFLCHEPDYGTDCLGKGQFWVDHA